MYLIQLLFVAKGSSTDNRSSWFPKRCHFGASLSVITNFMHTRRAVKKSITARLFMCACARCDKCLCVCALGENECFVLLAMVFFWCCCWFGFNCRRNGACFPTSAEQTCGHDKMGHFLHEEACFKCNHFLFTLENHEILESAAPDCYDLEFEGHSVLKSLNRQKASSATWSHFKMAHERLTCSNNRAWKGLSGRNGRPSSLRCGSNGLTRKKKAVRPSKPLQGGPDFSPQILDMAQPAKENRFGH